MTTLTPTQVRSRMRVLAEEHADLVWALDHGRDSAPDGDSSEYAACFDAFFARLCEAAGVEAYD
jgi:hypothetical protein